MNNNEKLATTSQNQQVAPVILLGDSSASYAAPAQPANAAPQPAAPVGNAGNNGKIKRPGHGFAITSFVLGILAILLVFVSIFDFYFFPLICGLGIAASIMAIIFAAIAKKKGDTSGFATAGLVMGIIPLAIFMLFIVACAGCAGCLGALMASA